MSNPFARAWSAIASVFSATKAPADSIGSSVWAGLARTGRPPTRGTPQMLQAYGDVPRLRAVVERVATSTAAVPWQAHALRPGVTKEQIRGAIRKEHASLRGELVKRLSDNGVLKPLAGHPALDLLNKPHPDLTAAQVRETIQTHVELVGESFVAIERTKSKKPAEMWPLPPSWVRRCPQPGLLSFQVQYPGMPPREIPSEDMIWIRKVNPASPYGRGSGIAATANNELDADEYAARATAARFWNNATPDLIVNVPGMDKDSLETTKQRWFDDSQGYQKAGRPHFTNAPNGLDVKQLSNSFVELDLVNLRKFLGDAIREIWGVPPEIMGVVENSNRATITQAQRLFAIYVLVPRLDALEDAWNSWLMPMFGDDSTVLLYENPVPDDKDFAMEIMRFSPSAFSIDDIRDMAGKTALPNGRGKVHPVPIGVMLTDLQDTTQIPERYTPDDAGDGDADKPEPTTSDPQEGEGQDEHASDGGKEEPPAKSLAAETKRIMRRVKAMDDPRIRAVLGSVDARKLSAHAENLWRQQLVDWVQAEASEYGETPPLDLVSGTIEEHVREFAGDRIDGINETTREALADTLAEGIDDGDTQRELIERVQGVFTEASDVRADTIARTEANRSSNFGITEGQRFAGIERREWVSNKDGVTRDAHVALDGQVVGIDEPFEIEGDSAMFPGDFDSPALSIGCRCTTAAVTSEKTPAVRRAIWKRFDRKLTAWERRAAVVFRAGFKAQEKAAIAALKAALKKREAA